MRDTLRLRSVDVTFRLNQPEALLGSRDFLSRISSQITADRKRKPTILVAETQGELLGLAEYLPSMPDLRWQLASLGLQHASLDPLPIWGCLLEEGVRLAGSAGVKRLYARALVDSAVSLALRQAGYVPYARERIYASTRPSPGTTGVPMRQQERTDTWAVHQLYNGSVPREVLYAEAYTSHRWELSEGRSVTKGEVRAWLHEVNHTPMVYARSESAQRKHVLDVIYAPGNVRLAAQLLDSLILDSLDNVSGGETYLAVRSYNSELEQFLLERNFGLYLEQDLYVRYTTAPLRVVTTETVLQEGDVHERAPKGVPAYYRDGAEHALSVSTFRTVGGLSRPGS